jgi:hypothetical protein
MSSEWMKVMLEEISRKKAEAEQARIEEQVRAEERARLEKPARTLGAGPPPGAGPRRAKHTPRR